MAGRSLKFFADGQMATRRAAGAADKVRQMAGGGRIARRIAAVWDAHAIGRVHPNQPLDLALSRIRPNQLLRIHPNQPGPHRRERSSDKVLPKKLMKQLGRKSKGNHIQAIGKKHVL